MRYNILIYYISDNLTLIQMGLIILIGEVLGQTRRENEVADVCVHVYVSMAHTHKKQNYM